MGFLLQLLEDCTRGYLQLEDMLIRTTFLLLKNGMKKLRTGSLVLTHCRKAGILLQLWLFLLQFSVPKNDFTNITHLNLYYFLKFNFWHNVKHLLNNYQNSFQTIPYPSLPYFCYFPY